MPDFFGSLTGKTAIVTGGTQGIGAAITSRLLEHGARVSAWYRQDEEAALRLAQSANGAGERLLTQRVDVREAHAVEAAVQACAAQFRTIDILVNNAGIQSPVAPFEAIDEAAWREVFATNVFGVVTVSRAVLPPMKGRGWGRIINIASISALEGYPRCSPYAASKASLLGLTRSLAKECAACGVTVNAVLPGITASRAASALPSDVYERIMTLVPIGRCAEPDEVAALVCFLSTESASYISGATITVTGGR